VRRSEAGFTIIELMISLTVLLIGISGVLALQLTSLRSTTYSRRAQEASVLGEDTLERLRLSPAASLTSGTDVVNAQGIGGGTDAFYTRTWTVTQFAATHGTSTVDMLRIDVAVSWRERGSSLSGDVRSIQLQTERNR
jgi:type IV pilus assembly protein PilV